MSEPDPDNLPQPEPGGSAPSAAGHPRDLPLWLTALVPCLVMLAFIASVLIDLDSASWWLAKEASFFEHGTVLVLLPGIAAGVYAFARAPFPARWLRWWTLAWTLACIYFMGEEASWGQHYFGWSTPEPIAEINKQQETNLHNTSSWLNMQPRSLVEFWILVGGIIIPVARAFEKPPSPPRPDPGRAADWFWPTSVGIAAAAMNYLGRAFDALRHGFDQDTEAHTLLTTLGPAEAREFFIALFLSIYLLSLAARTRSIRARSPRPQPEA